MRISHIGGLVVGAEILQGLRAGGPLVLCPGREGPPLGTWTVSRWTGRQRQEGRTATGGWWGHGCRGVGLAAGRGARLPAGTEGTVPLLVASPSWQESDFVHGCSPAPTCLSQETNWVEEIRSHRKFVSAWFRGHRLRMAKFREQPWDWAADVGERVSRVVRSGGAGAGLWVGQACDGKGCSGWWQVWDKGWAVCQAPKSSGSADGTRRTAGGCGKQGTLGWIVYPTSMTLWSLGRQPYWEVGSLLQVGWSG